MGLFQKSDNLASPSMAPLAKLAIPATVPTIPSAKVVAANTPVLAIAFPS